MLKLRDLLHVRLRAPDLDVARKFTEAFGLPTVKQSDRALYSRGTDAGACCHIMEKGEPGFIGAAFLAASRDALVAASQIAGASPIEVSDEPSGGERVRLTDPDGFRIDIMHGIALLDAIPVDHHPVNSAAGRRRADGKFYRRPPGPAQVRRLGHFVISTPDVKRSRAWYRETLGLLGTDDVFAGKEDNIVATFSRLPRGDEFVDHHVIMMHYDTVANLNHLGFEVQDYDDIFFGLYHMKAAEIQHRWGPGRHRLGSQVYNQWFDPWGRAYEHWTDTDVLNETHELELISVGEALKSQWGDPPPIKLE